MSSEPIDFAAMGPRGEDGDVVEEAAAPGGAQGRERGARAWTLTLFAPLYCGADAGERLPKFKVGTFFVGQVEEAPTTKKRHMQAYVRFGDAKTLSAVKWVPRVESPFGLSLY